ncbi:MAG: hypothetical protein N3A59_01595 [Thermodesulfovibrionales bacterium]|nr:hypothetical protein [Thermodesulfovibrionales bacterium]
MLELKIDSMVSCPYCNSEAFYKYGKTKTQKQRFRCLICNRQFSLGGNKLQVQGKPCCPICGKAMHLYRIELDIVRFRCSNYPGCKTFRKFKIQEEES